MSVRADDVIRTARGEIVSQLATNCYNLLYGKKNLYRLSDCLDIRFLALGLSMNPGELVLDVLANNVGPNQYAALANTYVYLRNKVVERTLADAVPRKGFRAVKRDMALLLECTHSPDELSARWQRGVRDPVFDVCYKHLSDAFIALSGYLTFFERRISKCSTTTKTPVTKRTKRAKKVTSLQSLS